ncbi:MAG: hypothetical protein P1V18_00595 [Candidatus Gracilibacteria bacterium]|nr:hypothetical protein [Candidatus Gracilibacteria bacterium]
MKNDSPIHQEKFELLDSFQIKIHHDRDLFEKPGAFIQIDDPKRVLTSRHAEWYYRHEPVSELQQNQREVMYIVLDGGEARSGTYDTQGFDVVGHFQQKGAHVLMIQNGDPGQRCVENIPGTNENDRLILMHRELIQKVFLQFVGNPLEHLFEKPPAIIPIGFSLTALSALIMALEHNLSPYIICPEMILISPSSAYYLATYAEKSYREHGFPLPDEDGDFYYVSERLKKAFKSFNNPDFRRATMRMNTWEMCLSEEKYKQKISPVVYDDRLSVFQDSNNDTVCDEELSYAWMTYVLSRLVMFQNTATVQLHLYGSIKENDEEHGWAMWTQMLGDTKSYPAV